MELEARGDQGGTAIIGEGAAHRTAVSPDDLSLRIRPSFELSFDGAHPADVLLAFLLGVAIRLVDRRGRLAEGGAVVRSILYLLARLLSQVDQRIKLTVYALAACRAFDRALYTRLCSRLELTPSRADFEVLRSLSFMRRLGMRSESDRQPGGEEPTSRYAVHPLIRRLLHEEQEPITREAHEVLERFVERTRSLAPAGTLFSFEGASPRAP
jgi:hypothetical protein